MGGKFGHADNVLICQCAGFLGVVMSENTTDTKRRSSGAYLRGWTNGTEPPPEGKVK